jgi:acyl-CoA synthetase (AMP-forming)/AMP-acid ligase II
MPSIPDTLRTITLVDRLKDLIITGGRNVYSAEVENALAGYPGLPDVAVIGVPRPDRGLQGPARRRGASHPAEPFGEDPEAPAASGADPSLKARLAREDPAYRPGQ